VIHETHHPCRLSRDTYFCRRLHFAFRDQGTLCARDERRRDANRRHHRWQPARGSQSISAAVALRQL